MSFRKSFAFQPPACRLLTGRPRTHAVSLWIAAVKLPMSIAAYAHQVGNLRQILANHLAFCFKGLLAWLSDLLSRSGPTSAVGDTITLNVLRFRKRVLQPRPLFAAPNRLRRTIRTIISGSIVAAFMNQTVDPCRCESCDMPIGQAGLLTEYPLAIFQT